jgi:hypothetical protein
VSFSRAVRRLAAWPPAQVLARAGFVAKAILYADIGWYALRRSFAQHGPLLDPKAALVRLARSALGRPLAALVGLGIVCLGCWFVVEALATPGRGGRLWSAVTRIGQAAGGIAYVALGTIGFRVLLGLDPGPSGDALARSSVAEVLLLPGGPELGILLAAIGVAVGLRQAAQGIRRTFLGSLDLARASRALRRAAVVLGAVGFTAQGVLFAAAGARILEAVVERNPREASGTHGVLRVLAHVPGGAPVLGVWAVGLLAYAAYALIEGGARRFPGGERAPGRSGAPSFPNGDRLSARQGRLHPRWRLHPGTPAGSMAELQNEFSWSKSRHERFAECRRAYFYTYYASWGGWEAEHGTAVRELYVLKKLSSRWQWAGSVVHGTLKRMLQAAKATGTFWPLEKTLERTRSKARSEWGWSRDKSYWREPSQIVGLVEHEYGEVVPDAEWKRIYEEVIEGSLRAFYASPLLEELRRVPREQWLSVDELDSWEFEGTKIWVAVDFAYRDADGRVHILDWKTGKERGVDHTQVGIYALYAQRKWSVAPEEVRGGLVYLAPPAHPEPVEGRAGPAKPGNGSPGGEVVPVRADAGALLDCQGKMRSSIAAMRAMLLDPAKNAAVEETFPRPAEREACRRCAFRRPCGRL